MSARDQRQRMLGGVLVGAQFALLAIMAWQVVAHPPAALPADALALAAAAAALGLWALSANRPGNFNIRPLPRPDGVLIVHGPYRWIRHPMYSAVLLAGAAACRLDVTARLWWLWAALALVLLAKAGIEEAAMLQRYPDYAGYRRRTRRLLPYIF